MPKFGKTNARAATSPRSNDSRPAARDSRGDNARGGAKGAPKTGAGKKFGAPARGSRAGAPTGKSWEDGRQGRAPHRDAPRDSRDGRPQRDDRRKDWSPRNGEGTGAPRKSRYNADDRRARDERPAYNRDDRAPRQYGDRDARPAYNRDDRAPRQYGNRDDRAPRRENEDRPRRYEDRAPRENDRSRDERPAQRRTFGTDRPQLNFGDRRRDDRDNRSRDERPAQRRSFGEDRRPDRADRVERDRSRDTTFRGARDANPNKKAFFEDVKLERLESVDASDATIADSFESMDLHPKIILALQGMGAESPFPIQAATIPAAIGGMDVLGRGKTGSGKTVAFTVPVVMKLIAGGSQPRKAGKPRALILAPTRELADQIDRTVNGIARPVGFYTTCVYGGVPQRKQENAMSRGVDIVVATPGRLEDLMAQGIIDLSEVETMVVDEADHMCDLGFIEGVRRIMRACGDSQKLLFSATLDKEVDALVREFLPAPYVYEVPNEVNDTANITHRVLIVDQEDRSQVLLRLVQGHGKSLIFTRTKMTAERLSESLTAAGVPAARLHGDLNQNQRNRNLERFIKGGCRVLVATDVAARGIHVDDIALVVQVDPPEEYKTYLHRAGRTGRAGKEGTVITLIPRSRRRRMEDLLNRAERDGIFSEVRPKSELLEDLAGPIAPLPEPESLDFGDSRGGSSRDGGRGRSNGGRGRDGGSREKRGNYGGSGKGRWADRPAGESRPRAKKYAN